MQKKKLVLKGQSTNPNNEEIYFPEFRITQKDIDDLLSLKNHVVQAQEITKSVLHIAANCGTGKWNAWLENSQVKVGCNGWILFSAYDGNEKIFTNPIYIDDLQDLVRTGDISQSLNEAIYQEEMEE